MANPEHVRIVRQGGEAIGKWRQDNPGIRIDLSGMDLSEEVFRGVDLSGADFRGSNLSRATFCIEFGPTTPPSRDMMVKARTCLNAANFSHANLQESEFLWLELSLADFSNANLSMARFSSVDLSKARLELCLLNGTTFRDCTLNNARLFNCMLVDALFVNCDLRGAAGLEMANYLGPSTIGIDTILRSQGDIPREFLQGCGLPDDVIEYVKSLKPAEFYSCFLAHSSEDESFVEYLHNKLQEAGARCWYFSKSARTGQKVWEEIDLGICDCDKTVVICSPNSLNSEPVIKEIKRALKRETEEATRRLEDHERVEKGEMSLEAYERERYRTRVLFPITIDDYVFEGWKHPLQNEVAGRVVANFRGWNDVKKFTQEFDKLLKNLKVKDSD